MATVDQGDITLNIYEKVRMSPLYQKMHKDILDKVMETSSYQQIKEASVKHICSILSDKSLVMGPQSLDDTKRKVNEVSNLTADLDNSLTTIIKEKYETEVSIAEAAVKEYMCPKTTVLSPKQSPEKVLIADEKDDDDDDEMSAASVSSVHTSDLSSFDDKISVIKEDKVFKVPFQKVEKIYFKNNFVKKVLTPRRKRGNPRTTTSKIIKHTGSERLVERKLGTRLRKQKIPLSL